MLHSRWRTEGVDARVGGTGVVARDVARDDGLEMALREPALDLAAGDDLRDPLEKRWGS